MDADSVRWQMLISLLILHMHAHMVPPHRPTEQGYLVVLATSQLGYSHGKAIITMVIARNLLTKLVEHPSRASHKVIGVL